MKIIVLVVVALSLCLIGWVIREYSSHDNNLLLNHQPTIQKRNDPELGYKMYRLYINNRRKRFYKKSQKQKAYYIVYEWINTSEKTIVLEFYEFLPEKWIRETVAYLSDTGESEIAEMMEKGIHDYHNPKYTDMCDYPEEWVDDCFEIDDWITKNKERLHQWLEINENRNKINRTSSNKHHSRFITVKILYIINAITLLPCSFITVINMLERLGIIHVWPWDRFFLGFIIPVALLRCLYLPYIITVVLSLIYAVMLWKNKSPIKEIVIFIVVLLVCVLGIVSVEEVFHAAMSV